ncbi:PREDICTED: protein NRT1/ PTR FAMILY 5.5-like [Ipomoea nil]|uniref:protein NRT1/ PTR FAMILY 5.5-like n=1 Tax=Ipomoea nil TaxID=35883 RepID=UPI000900BD04|nr:PREDICTED: protein NRT1/ PTR FAMILY 5.5-like [Ipomoea nil]
MACIKLRGECTIACTMVSGLKWGHIIAEYALFLLINYLTNTWGLGFANAAGIINLFFGITKILEICFAFVADACLGTFKALLLSSLLYSIGLAFLTMSTPPVLSNFAGNCNRYEAECVGPVQKAFFFTSLVLMGVGMAGHAVSLDAFLRHHQTPCHDDHLNQQADEEEEKEDEFWSVNNLLVILISGVAALALSNIGPWEIKFAVPAIFFFTATLVFFAGKALGFYSNYGDKPKGSALTTLLRVFVAATCKSCRKLPANSDELYQAHDANHKLSHTNGCWWLDKAAIPLPKEESRWKLCNVREVEETKLSVQTAMVWPPIIICGLVSSIGSTFFVVQAGKMSHNLGKWQVPPTILLLLSNAAKYGTTACFKLGVKDELGEGGRRREEMRELGPGSAML